MLSCYEAAHQAYHAPEAARDRGAAFGDNEAERRARFRMTRRYPARIHLNAYRPC